MATSMKKMSLPLSAVIKLPVTGRGDGEVPVHPTGNADRSGLVQVILAAASLCSNCREPATEGDRCVQQWTQSTLEGSLTGPSCLFNKTALSSLLGTTASPAIGF